MNQQFNELFEKYKIYKKPLLSKGAYESLEKLQRKVNLYEKSKGVLYLYNINLDWFKYFMKNLTNGKYGKCTNETLKLYSSLLCSFLRQAKIHGYEINNDFERIVNYSNNLKKANYDKPILLDSELATLWKYRGYYLKNGNFRKVTKYQKYGLDLFIFQTQLGLRWGDLKRIRREHLVEKNDKWYIVDFETQKRGKTVCIHINELALEVIRKYRPNFETLKGKTLIFRKVPSCSNSTHNLKIIGKRCNLDREVIIKHCKLNKLKSRRVPLYSVLSTHIARRVFASNWITDGRDIYKLKTILGHSSIKTTEKYIKSIKGYIPEDIETDLSENKKLMFLID